MDTATQFPLGLTFGQGHVVDVGEGLTEGMGLRELGGAKNRERIRRSSASKSDSELRTAIAFGPYDDLCAMVEDRHMMRPPFLAQSMRLGDASSSTLALCIVSGVVHMNFQDIGVGDVAAVDGDLRRSNPALVLSD